MEISKLIKELEDAKTLYGEVDVRTSDYYGSIESVSEVIYQKEYGKSENYILIEA